MRDSFKTDEWAHSVRLVRGVEKHTGFLLRVCVCCMAVLNVISLWTVGSDGGGHPPVPATHSRGGFKTKTRIQPPATALFPPTHACNCNCMHSCVYTYSVTLWQKPRCPTRIRPVPFFIFTQLSLPRFSFYFAHSLPQDKQVVKSNESSTSVLPPSLMTNKPTRGFTHKATPAIRRWFNMAISLNVTQHWLRARPTIQPH